MLKIPSDKQEEWNKHGSSSKVAILLNGDDGISNEGFLWALRSKLNWRDKMLILNVKFQFYRLSEIAAMLKYK